MISFVRETRGARLRRRDRVARRALPRPGRVRGELVSTGREPEESAIGCFALLEQAATFYERTLWDSAGRRDGAGVSRRGAGSQEEICHEFRLGLSLGGESLARKALEKGFPREELPQPG